MEYLPIVNCVWLIILLIGAKVLFWIWREKPRWSFRLTLLVLLFVLVLIARITVNRLGSKYLDQSEYPQELSGAELFLDGFVQAFQTFSMDTDYALYTKAGKRLYIDAGMESEAAAYGIMISVLNVAAPLAGGFILLDVLLGFFPKAQLLLHLRRRKFVFSELNEASMTLAEDLNRNHKYKKVFYWEKWCCKPLFVFTDSYQDRESEGTSELFERARTIGACCVKTDLLHLAFRCSKSVHYFLMDKDEHSNLSALAGLLEEFGNEKVPWPRGEEQVEKRAKNKRWRQKEIPEDRQDPPVKDPRTRVYVFCQSDLCVEMINKLCRDKDCNKAILVRPIRDYANAAVLLMNDVPLFLPFLGEKNERYADFLTLMADNPNRDSVVPAEEYEQQKGIVPSRDLHVVILGNGAIAEETLKAVFWCGQMSGIQLYIHVISKNTDILWKRIQAHCPEFMDSCEKTSALLKLYPHIPSSGLLNPPYAFLDHTGETADPENPAEYKKILKKADYIIVALGEDERNLSVSSILAREISKLLLQYDDSRKPVIAPAVFDSRLAQAARVTNPEKFYPYIIPFATMDIRFGCRNVFMADFTENALKGEKMYNQKANLKRQQDEYFYWANIMRAVHAPYKLYAMGCIEKVDLDKEGPERFEGTWKKNPADDDQFLAWMEHRRWNAYMRTCGFCCPTPQQHEHYFEKTGLHKDLARKLHNCLVEGSVRGNGMPEEKYNQDDSSYEEYDALDMVAIKSYYMTCLKDKVNEDYAGRVAFEYKHWDYYTEDPAFNELITRFIDRLT